MHMSEIWHSKKNDCRLSRTQVFRKWANSILKQYLIRGYAIDQRRLDHYDELKDVVRLMSRAITLQDKVSEGEYSGLFSIMRIKGRQMTPYKRQKTVSSY